MEVVHTSLERMRSSASAKVVVMAGQRFRVAAIQPGAGWASAAEGTTVEAAFEWSAVLPAMTDLMITAPSWARSAFITRGNSWGGTATGFGVHASERERPRGVPSMPPQRRGVDSAYLLDAFGCFMRRDAPAPMADLDPTQWHVRQDGETVLVEHRNAAAWYGERHINGELREAARQDLARYLPPRLPGDRPIGW